MTDPCDQLRALQLQEVRAYGTVDYLAADYQESLAQNESSLRWGPGDGSNDETVSSGAPSLLQQQETLLNNNKSASSITELWREKICEWEYAVVDTFNFSREVVAIAMNYLDRYLATKTVNTKVFQLAAMTALFLAVKMHERTKLSMHSMMELGRGRFTLEQMSAMEISLISTLGWLLHPPTAQCFAHLWLRLIPANTLNADVFYDVLELSRFLTELSVIDYFFVTQRPSYIGLAAVAHALRTIHAVPSQVSDEFERRVQSEFDLNVESNADLLECRFRLNSLCTLQGNPTFGNGGQWVDADSQRSTGVSPVCVSYGTHSYTHPSTAAANMNTSSGCSGEAWTVHESP